MVLVADRTNSPPTNHQAIENVKLVLDRSTSIRITGDDGSTAELSPELTMALSDVVDALHHGNAVSVDSISTTLTTQEAADLLGISRPTMAKYLDEGCLPSERPGTHRRIRLDDVIAFQQENQRSRAETLAELTRDSQSMPHFGGGFVKTR